MEPEARRRRGGEAAAHGWVASILFGRVRFRDSGLVGRGLVDDLVPHLVGGVVEGAPVREGLDVVEDVARLVPSDGHGLREKTADNAKDGLGEADNKRLERFKKKVSARKRACLACDQ